MLLVGVISDSNSCLVNNFLVSPLSIFLQILEAEERIGSKKTSSYEALKSHPFFQGVDWEALPTSQAPKLVPYLPAMDDHNAEDLWSDMDEVRL